MQLTALAVLQAAGMLAALGVGRTLQNFVWNVSTMDPVTFVVVGFVLIVVAVMASLVPALRALRLDPMAALRE